MRKVKGIVVRTDKEDRKRVLLMMPHIHSHTFISPTDEELERCTACQQDRAGWQPNKFLEG